MADEQEIRETFDLFDSKEEGYLDSQTAKELLNSFGLMVSEEELTALGNKVDFDKVSSFISNKMKEPKNENLEGYFKDLVNKKGELSAKKFRKLLMNFGLKFSENEAEEVINEFKVDGEGNISWREFCHSMA